MVPDTQVRLEAAVGDAGKRLDHFLQERLPAFSRSRLQDWIRQGRVLVDGRAVKASFTLRGGENLVVEPAAPPPLKAGPEDLPLEILYEDEDLVAVNKPAGMVVHAGAGHFSGTLVNALLHRFHTLSGVGGEERPGIVHRLDRDTSGVLLVARTDSAHRALAAQFAARQARKLYLAMVHGVPRDSAGRIELPIGRDPVRRMRMSVRAPTGRPAVTEYRLLRRFERFSFIEVRILTGRTHQIRVHMASLGHPVVGDRLYGAPGGLLDRFFLHAWKLTVTSPSRGAPLTIEAPLPAALESWMGGLSESLL